MKASAIVQASCRFCGPVELPARAFSCGVDPDVPQQGLCQFTCPSCARLFLGTARAAADVLLVEGARPFAGPAPFVLREAHRGAPLSGDDLLDFHLALSASPLPQEEVVPVGDESTM